MKDVKVLIVDDSATIRAMIAQVLSADSGIEVVGEARDPLEAREEIKRLNPDVITLDIEMPHMDGLSFLEKIMRLRPTPVIIVSSLSKRGAAVTLQALEMGAIDCIEKPRPGNEDSFLELPARVRAAARARVATPRLAFRNPASSAAPAMAAPPARAQSPADDCVVAIGASTGGVEALISVISGFPADCAPTVIVQHMPPLFTTSFAQRLDRLSPARVFEARDGAPLQRGTVYLAPGGDAHLEITGPRNRLCVLRKGERVNQHCPSVDVLFRSVARTCGASAVGLLLTGMGRDGAEGLLEMRQAGARTVVQDEATCVVYGMPKAAVDIGAAKQVLPLHGMSYAAIRGFDAGGLREGERARCR
jgi:two-component system chemotaxis response regulator CheB